MGQRLFWYLLQEPSIVQHYAYWSLALLIFLAIAAVQKNTIWGRQK